MLTLLAFLKLTSFTYLKRSSSSALRSCSNVVCRLATTPFAHSRMAGRSSSSQAFASSSLPRVRADAGPDHEPDTNAPYSVLPTS